MQFVITSTKVLAEIHSMAKQLSKFFLLMDTSFVINSHASTLSICYCNSSSGASNPSLISPNFCRTTAFGLDNFISLHFGWGFISFQKLPKVSWYISSHDKLSLISWSFVIFCNCRINSNSSISFSHFLYQNASRRFVFMNSLPKNWLVRINKTKFLICQILWIG